METRYCPHCGSSVEPESERCPTCGATLAQATQVASPVQPDGAAQATNPVPPAIPASAVPPPPGSGSTASPGYPVPAYTGQPAPNPPYRHPYPPSYASAPGYPAYPQGSGYPPVAAYPYGGPYNPYFPQGMTGGAAPAPTYPPPYAGLSDSVRTVWILRDAMARILSGGAEASAG